ncbi:unnamed protein product [Calypogeia fissa]
MVEVEVQVEKEDKGGRDLNDVNLVEGRGGGWEVGGGEGEGRGLEGSEGQGRGGRHNGRGRGLNTVADWAFKACLLVFVVTLAIGSFLLFWVTFWGNRLLCLVLRLVRGAETRLLWGISQTGALACRIARALCGFFGTTSVSPPP